VQRIDEENERAKQRRLDNSLGLLGVRLGFNTLGYMAPDPGASKFLIGKVVLDHASPWKKSLSAHTSSSSAVAATR
jgi:hypothetical protein